MSFLLLHSKFVLVIRSNTEFRTIGFCIFVTCAVAVTDSITHTLEMKQTFDLLGYLIVFGYTINHFCVVIFAYLVIICVFKAILVSR